MYHISCLRLLARDIPISGSYHVHSHMWSRVLWCLVYNVPIVHPYIRNRFFWRCLAYNIFILMYKIVKYALTGLMAILWERVEEGAVARLLFFCNLFHLLVFFFFLFPFCVIFIVSFFLFDKSISIYIKANCYWDWGRWNSVLVSVNNGHDGDMILTCYLLYTVPMYLAIYTSMLV